MAFELEIEIIEIWRDERGLSALCLCLWLCLCGLIMYNIYVTCGTQHSIVGEKGYSGIDLVTDL